MAQTKAADPKKDFEELSEQIATLRNDLGAITETLKNAGVHSRDAAVNNARQTAADLQARGQDGLRHAQSSAEEMGAQAAQTVRNQPAAAVGLAVGVGFLLGFMSGRK